MSQRAVTELVPTKIAGHHRLPRLVSDPPEAMSRVMDPLHPRLHQIDAWDDIEVSAAILVQKAACLDILVKSSRRRRG